jgi:hypothetical protein
MLLTAHPGLIRSHQHCCGSGGKRPTLADSIASDKKKCGTVALDCQVSEVGERCHRLAEHTGTW